MGSPDESHDTRQRHYMTLSSAQHGWEESFQDPEVRKGVRAECAVHIVTSALREKRCNGYLLGDIFFGKVEKELAFDNACVVDNNCWVANLKCCSAEYYHSKGKVYILFDLLGDSLYLFEFRHVTDVRMNPL